jgi:hypothetical protein
MTLLSLFIAVAMGASDETDPPSPQASPAPTQSSPAFQPSMDWQIYGNVSIGYTQSGEPDISLGMVDLFASAQISRRISAVSETMVGTMDGMAMVHAARLFLDARLHNSVSLRIGRFHTPMAWYTSHYPHGGAVYRLMVNRPRLLSMEMGEEMLPQHMEGAKIYGTVGPNALGIQYDIAAGQTDHSDNRFVGAGRVCLIPGGPLYGLEIGSSYFAGTAQASNGHGSMTMSMGDESEEDGVEQFEQIATVYVSYRRYPAQFNAEYIHVRHSENAFRGPYLTLRGAWAQLGLAYEAWTPYARFEWFERNAADPLYDAAGAPDSLLSTTAGINWNINEKVVAKAEFGYDLNKRLFRTEAQLAFSF